MKHKSSLLIALLSLTLTSCSVGWIRIGPVIDNGGSGSSGGNSSADSSTDSNPELGNIVAMFSSTKKISFEYESTSATYSLTFLMQQDSNVRHYRQLFVGDGTDFYESYKSYNPETGVEETYERSDPDGSFSQSSNTLTDEDVMVYTSSNYNSICSVPCFIAFKEHYGEATKIEDTYVIEGPCVYTYSDSSYSLSFTNIEFSETEEGRYSLACSLEETDSTSSVSCEFYDIGTTSIEYPPTA